MKGPFLAIDWGTSNRRVFRVSETGAVEHTVRDDLGSLAMKGRDWAVEVVGIRAANGDLPVLIAGMAGSTIGWREAPYIPVAADAGELARGVLRIDERTVIVPGVCVNAARADVMRGEETQLVGAVAAGLAPATGLLAQPGTHNKWVRMENAAIADFRTVMTGELFGLLRRHSILASQMAGEAALNDAFDQGVEAARAGTLLADLFGIRAGGLLGRIAPEDAVSYASGLLIGADVAAGCAWSDCPEAFILAGEPHASLYTRALELHGRRATIVKSHDAFIAGARLIQDLL